MNLDCRDVPHPFRDGGRPPFPDGESDAARTETESFLGKVYGGSLGLMMSAMVEGRALTQEDIDELTAILEQAGGNTK